MTRAMWASEIKKTVQHAQITATIRSRSLQTLTSAEGDERSAIGSKRWTTHVHNVVTVVFAILDRHLPRDNRMNVKMLPQSDRGVGSTPWRTRLQLCFRERFPFASLYRLKLDQVCPARDLGAKMSDPDNDPHDPSVGSDLGTDSLIHLKVPHGHRVRCISPRIATTGSCCRLLCG